MEYGRNNFYKSGQFELMVIFFAGVFSCGPVVGLSGECKTDVCETQKNIKSQKPFGVANSGSQ